LGSTIHFFHALIEGQTADEGFLLLNILTQKTYDSIVRASSRTPLDSTKPKTATIFKTDMQIGRSILPTDIMRRDSLNGNVVYALNWLDKLRVTYKKNPYPKTYLKRSHFMAGSLPIGVYSDVVMLIAPAYLDGNGSLYNPLAIQMGGYWSYEKMAGMLPINYRPSR
ncbi:MAG: hypothetical protein H7Y31_14090, partial [Chitinophagaceae bacterium]|nr:hypothetical protein [Chitinophagaceae bacterium]